MPATLPCGSVTSSEPMPSATMMRAASRMLRPLAIITGLRLTTEPTRDENRYSGLVAHRSACWRRSSEKALEM